MKPCIFLQAMAMLTNLTPNEFINITRLKKAAELLANKKYKIYEVSDMVGYASHTNFGRNFFKQFGMTPTEYQRKYLKIPNTRFD